MVEFYDPIAKANISYHIDAKLVKMWDKLKLGKLELANDDRVYIVDGRERSGKSSFTIQQAKYLDPNFTIDQIVFNPKDFMEKLRNSKKGQVVVFDEAFRGLSSKASRSKLSKEIVEILMEVGQRNLVIFIVMPTLFLLELYAAVFRSHALFHIYKLKPKDGGTNIPRCFKIYNYFKKNQLYQHGKTRYFTYAWPRINKAKGRFFVNKTDEYPQGTPYSTFDLKGYLEKKDKAFSSGSIVEEKELSKNDKKYIMQRDLIIKALYKEQFKSYRKLSAWLGLAGIELSRSDIGRILGRLAENEEKTTVPGDEIILSILPK